MATISSKEFFKAGPVKTVGSDQQYFESDVDSPGMLEKLWTGAKTFGKNLTEDFKQRGQKIIDISQKVGSGDIDPISFGTQVAGQIAGATGDIITESAKTVLPQSIKNPIKDSIRSVAETKPAQDAMAGYQEWKNAHPDAAANLEAVLNIASLVPAGKGVTVAGDVAAQSAARVAKGIVDPAVDAVTVAGRAMKGAGKLAYDSAITPTVKEAEKILAYKATAPFLTRVKSALSGTPIKDEAGNIIQAPVTRARTALEKGIVGTESRVGIQAKRMEQKLWKESIEPELRSSTERITKDDLFKPALERIEKMTEPGKRQAYLDAFEVIQKEYKDFIDTTLIDGNKIKTQLDEFTPEKVFRGKPIGNEYSQLRADMANGIRQKIYESLKDENIKKQFLDYSNLKELEKVGVKAISEGGMKGGFGTFWSSMWDAVTTPVKTIGGQVLYKVGDKLEFVGQKGIKRFGDYLESKGFQGPDVGMSVKNVGVAQVKGQSPVPVNQYQVYEPGAYPKSLRQAESIPMTPQESAGFRTEPIMNQAKKSKKRK